MAAPMAALSVGALAVGWTGPLFSRALKSGWLAPQTPVSLPEFSWPVFLIGTGAAVVGAAGAWWLTMSNPSWDWNWRKRRPALERVFDADFGWRAVVGFFARLAVSAAGLINRRFDEGFLDVGIIEGSASAVLATSEAAGGFATGLLNDYIWWMAVGAAALLFVMLRFLP